MQPLLAEAYLEDSELTRRRWCRSLSILPPYFASSRRRLTFYAPPPGATAPTTTTKNKHGQPDQLSDDPFRPGFLLFSENDKNRALKLTRGVIKRKSDHQRKAIS